jgi:type VI protein secretion system component Hcp
VTGYSQSSGGDQPTESVSLNFRGLKWSFTDAAGAVTSGP